MLTWLPHRTYVAVMAAAVVAATLPTACTPTGGGSSETGGRPPWLAPAAGAAVGPRPISSAPVPRLKPPPERQNAALAAEGRHLVMPGDTLIGLAGAFDIPARELARLNGLSPPYHIQVGQILTVRPQPPAEPPPPPQHVVQAGESLTVVAQRYGVGLSELARANDLQRPDVIRVGQTLRIPQGAGEVRGGTARVTLLGGAGSQASATAGDDSWVKTAALRSGEAAAAAEEGDGFLWPVEGKVVSTFGPKRSGRRNDGINIAARAGTPVRAAMDGVVVYVGDGFRGYGRMVLLRHADGYTTAYAHNSAVLVRENERVRRGAVIARVGDSGGVKEPQLHFELRRNGRALDPVDHLRRTTRVASSEN